MSTERKYIFPPSVGGGELVMRELTVGQVEDILAREAARTKDGGLMAFKNMQTECVKASIVSLHGESWPGGREGEKRWRGLAPRVEALIRKAYEALHQATGDEEKDFLSTADDGLNRDDPLA